MLDHGWEDHAAGARACGCGGDGKDSLAHKIRRDQGDARQPHKALTDAGAKALCQEDLPVLGGKAGHEGAEQQEDGAGHCHMPRKSRIGRAPGERRDEEQTKYLEPPDPRDVGWGLRQRGLVVVLEDAEAGGIPPSQGDDQMAGYNLSPGVEATVWRGQYQGDSADRLGAFLGAGGWDSSWEGSRVCKLA